VRPGVESGSWPTIAVTSELRRKRKLMSLLRIEPGSPPPPPKSVTIGECTEDLSRFVLSVLLPRTGLQQLILRHPGNCLRVFHVLSYLPSLSRDTDASILNGGPSAQTQSSFNSPLLLRICRRCLIPFMLSRTNAY
jgi:hypothetical protein